MENRKIEADLISLSICLSDLDKTKLKKADNGKIYLNATLSLRKEADKYGNDMTIFYSKTKEEREAKADTVYVTGNAKQVIFEAAKTPVMTEAVPTVSDMQDLPF
jgi:hypothetical protein